MNPPPKPRVLLVDDEDHVRILMRTIMKSINCDVVGEAKNGNEAVDLHKTLKPNLTLLDINMPYKTGIEALREIVENDPDSFVIMLTSLSDAESIQKCLDLGASNFIRKDNSVQEIKNIIKKTWDAFKESKR